MPSAKGLEIRIESGGDHRGVHVEGTLSIATAEELRAVLLEGMQPGAKTVLDTAGILATDLCGLQLLCSAHRTAVTHDAVFELRAMSEAVRDTAHAAAFDGKSVCRFRQGSNCLWKD